MGIIRVIINEMLDSGCENCRESKELFLMPMETRWNKGGTGLKYGEYWLCKKCLKEKIREAKRIKAYELENKKWRKEQQKKTNDFIEREMKKR